MSWVTRAFWLPFLGIFLLVALQAVIPEIFTKDITGAAGFALLICFPVGFGVGMNHYWRAWLAETMTLTGAVPPRSLPALFGSVPAEPPDQVFHCGIVTSVTRSVWRNRFEVAIYSLRPPRAPAPCSTWRAAGGMVHPLRRHRRLRGRLVLDSQPVRQCGHSRGKTRLARATDSAGAVVDQLQGQCPSEGTRGGIRPMTADPWRIQAGGTAYLRSPSRWC
jgi:hypothetical protein